MLPVATVELRTLSTTGGHQVWPAAAHLLSHLEQGQEKRLLEGESCVVIELGAGTGWLGITLALRHPRLRLVLTEQNLPAALDLLRHNVSLNASRLSSSVSVEPADFFSLSSVVNFGASLVVGSDLVYTREIAAAFPVFLKQLLLANNSGNDSSGAGNDRFCHALYCHTFRRFDFVDDALLDAFENAQLRVSELTPTGEEKKIVKIVPCDDVEEMELFPDQIIRILKIQLP